MEFLNTFPWESPISNFMEICHVGAALICGNRQTDMTKLNGAFCDYVNRLQAKREQQGENKEVQKKSMKPRWRHHVTQEKSTWSSPVVRFVSIHLTYRDSGSIITVWGLLVETGTLVVIYSHFLVDAILYEWIHDGTINLAKEFSRMVWTLW